jgi:hypothetical protein
MQQQQMQQHKQQHKHKHKQQHKLIFRSMNRLACQLVERRSDACIDPPSRRTRKDHVSMEARPVGSAHPGTDGGVQRPTMLRPAGRPLLACCRRAAVKATRSLCNISICDCPSERNEKVVPHPLRRGLASSSVVVVVARRAFQRSPPAASTGPWSRGEARRGEATSDGAAPHRTARSRAEQHRELRSIKRRRRQPATPWQQQQQLQLLLPPPRRRTGEHTGRRGLNFFRCEDFDFGGLRGRKESPRSTIEPSRSSSHLLTF